MQSSQLLMISGLTFLGCFLAVTGLYLFVESRRTRVEWKTRAAGFSVDGGLEAGSTLTGFGYVRELLTGALAKLGQANQAQRKDKEVSALRQMLTTAGYRGETAPATFIGAKLLLAIVFPVVLFVLPIDRIDSAPLTHQAMAYLMAAGAGLYAPELWLQRLADARKLKIVHAFPDALDLMVVCVEAGLGLDAAIGRIAKELNLAHPDLCDEFYLISLELRAGLPRAQTLTNFAKRVDLDEVRSFVALLIQTDRFGTSVSQALRVHSDSIRIDRRQKAEEKAGKLPVKMLFPLMLFIFPCLFIVILGPAVIQTTRTLLPALRGEK